MRSMGLLFPLIVFRVPIYLFQTGVNLKAGTGSPMLAESLANCLWSRQARNINE